MRELQLLIVYGAGEQRAAQYERLEDAEVRLALLNVRLVAAVGALEESRGGGGV